MLALILSIAVIAVVVWILQGAPMDAFLKRVIYGLCVIWLILIVAQVFFGVHLLPMRP